MQRTAPDFLCLKGSKRVLNGCGVQEHDENLFAVIHRLKECGLALNEKTRQFRFPNLTFFGPDLSSKAISPHEEKVNAIQNVKAPQSRS